jgi:RimJ/RimL family protein N-acetyltransferase
MSGIYNRQLYPLQVNAYTGEVFLRLPPPHSHIIITPPRISDVPSVIANMNDPRVYETISGPPFPYTEEHAVWWINTIKTQTDNVLRELEDVHSHNPEAPLCIVGHCPVRILREEKEDGADMFLGDCGLTRWGYQTVTDSLERQRLAQANEDRPLGDPEILWDVGGPTSH